MFKHKKSYFIPIIGFALIIIIGSMLLYIPSVNKASLSYRDCLFIATSGFTTTGITKGPLVSQFSFIGQVIIAVLMELGAMGFIIFVSYFWTMKHKKLKISDIMVINDSISGDEYSNITKHSIFICRYMFRVQALGALLLACRFVPLYGFATGIWYSIFHVISAFSNTGFDLFGTQSMIPFANDSFVQVVTIVVMILGSLGILVIEDLKDKKFKFSKLKVQTKIVVIASIILIIVPTILLIIYDSELSVINSLFMSASVRNTGMTIIDLNELSFRSKVLLAVLMLIGGGPTSTSGGIRILPVVILFATVISTLRGKTDTIIFWKKIPQVAVRRSITIITIFLFVLTVGTIVFYEFNDVGIQRIIFENISAISNTGFSVIKAEELNVVGNFVLMFLMFVGRVGPLSMVLAFVNDNSKDKYIEYPSENIVL